MGWQKILGSLSVVALIAGCASSGNAPATTGGASSAVLDGQEATEDGSTIWELFDRPDAEATVQV
ncbi:unnamed protein product, partial [Ectocarpus sp. 12 AP-2014]